MLAARASAFTLRVHAIEGGGVAVCGAHTSAWKLSSRLPVTCPECLLKLSGRRLALCGVPAARREPFHLRLLSREGFKPEGGPDTRTLCGRQPGWDVRVLRGSRPDPDEYVCRRCEAEAKSALDPSNGVR